MEWLSRTELLLGKEQMEKLQKAHILIAGIGGVGAYAAEMLARSGIGEITIVDADTVKPSNRNRQLIALSSTENQPKVEIMKQRMVDINPSITVNAIHEFMDKDKIPELLNQPFNYVIDAIDSLTPKIFLIVHSVNNKIPLISSMGAGGKMDPSKVQVSDISQSYQCRLARMVRKRLNKFDIKNGFNVVFSPEPTDKNHLLFVDDEPNKKTTLGTISYMPAIFGIMAASKVLRDLLNHQN
ncbi:tRNA threonylcarbamoyladenosine dehydratase [Geofilum sp. OHC36d9]|uniref:tRNA threonylcarbamoyladenosine dehydratase n=1 Tax=Geofilum sp. OHC36d9 TaxID=3458413 RepID=UPI004033B053